MINPNELRIGNWVEAIQMLTPFEGMVYRIDAFNIHVGFKNQTKLADPEEINPIPLTAEWLEKFGFEWDGNEMTNGRLRFYEVNTGNWYCLFHEGHEVIKSVHHLQNLYHSITLTELTVKK